MGDGRSRRSRSPKAALLPLDSRRAGGGREGNRRCPSSPGGTRMELLIAAAAAVLIHILANEACAHAPGLTGRLIGLAARRLPIAIRDRYREEWLAHMRDLPGALTKLGFGVQCVVASQALRAIPEEYWAQSRQRLIKVRDVEMLVDTNVLVQILTVFRQVKSEADVVAHLEREI